MQAVRETFERRVLPLLLAVLSGISLAAVVVEGSVGSDSLLARFTDEIDGVGPAFLVAVAALAVFYTRFWDAFRESSGPVTHVLAALFAAFTLVGMSYEALDSWDFILGRKKDLAFALVVFAGYFVLFDFCLAWLYRWLDGRLDTSVGATSGAASAADAAPGATSGAASAEGEGSPTRTGRLAAWADGHWFLFCLIVICLCWSPYLIFNLPGSVPYDGYYQLGMGTGFWELNNHHPWLLSVLYGLIMGIGRNVSDNFGIFLVVLTGFVTYALCYAGVCSKIRSWGAGGAGSVLSLLFFAVVPCFGAFAQAVWKDGFFAAFLALFLALYVDLCITVRRTQEIDRPLRRFVELLLLELAVSLTRNNGFYMMLAADVLLPFLLGRGARRRFGLGVALAACVCLGYWCVENPLADAYGVVEEEGSVKELLSVPFQQTARYLMEYPDDVTEEEAEAIDAVLPYDSLAERYDPSNADDVKNVLRRDSTDEELRAYFTDAWWPMFLKHPLVYVQAFLNNTYGYLYPFESIQELGFFPFYINSGGVYFDGKAQEADFELEYVFPSSVRSEVKTFANAWLVIPGLAQLVNPGAYTWVLLAMGGYLCRRGRYRDLLALVVPFLNICVCLISPVNGYLRYALPLIACTPVIIAWCAGSFAQPCDRHGRGGGRVASQDALTSADRPAPASGEGRA